MCHNLSDWKDIPTRRIICNSRANACHDVTSPSVVHPQNCSCQSPRRRAHNSIFSSPRLVTNNKCQPNCVFTGSLTLPTVPVLKATSSNPFTMAPGPNFPKLPPFLPDGQVLCFLASSSKSFLTLDDASSCPFNSLIF